MKSQAQIEAAIEALIRYATREEPFRSHPITCGCSVQCYARAIWNAPAPQEDVPDVSEKMQTVGKVPTREGSEAGASAQSQESLPCNYDEEQHDVRLCMTHGGYIHADFYRNENYDQRCNAAPQPQAEERCAVCDTARENHLRLADTPRPPGMLAGLHAFVPASAQVAQEPFVTEAAEGVATSRTTQEIAKDLLTCSSGSTHREAASRLQEQEARIAELQYKLDDRGDEYAVLEGDS